MPIIILFCTNDYTYTHATNIVSLRKDITHYYKTQARQTKLFQPNSTKMRDEVTYCHEGVQDETQQEPTSEMAGLVNRRVLIRFEQDSASVVECTVSVRQKMVLGATMKRRRRQTTYPQTAVDRTAPRRAATAVYSGSQNG